MIINIIYINTRQSLYCEFHKNMGNSRPILLLSVQEFSELMGEAFGPEKLSEHKLFKNLAIDPKPESKESETKPGKTMLHPMDARRCIGQSKKHRQCTKNVDHMLTFFKEIGLLEATGGRAYCAAHLQELVKKGQEGVEVSLNSVAPGKTICQFESGTPEDESFKARLKDANVQAKIAERLESSTKKGKRPDKNTSANKPRCGSENTKPGPDGEIHPCRTHVAKEGMLCPKHRAKPTKN